MIKGKGSGISFSVSFGHYGGFRKQLNIEFWRLVLGWVAISICWFDLDYVFTLLLIEKEKELRKKGGENGAILGEGR